MQGRLTEPMRYDAATDHYVPVSWDDAFALIGRHLRALASPDEAEFYTSGRTANEKAFLYSIFVREDRKSGVQGKSVSVRVDLGGCRLIKKKIIYNNMRKR